MATQTLRVAYCPPLDEALFYAIAYEYDLPQEHQTLVGVLDSLKASAVEQENAEFDPSGTGGFGGPRDPPDYSASGRENESTSNGMTSITTALSDTKLAEDGGLGADLEHSSVEQKEAWLHAMFPSIPTSKLSKILQSHDGALDTATDELLNLSFLSDEFEEEGPAEEIPPKGVDGFAEDRHGGGRKGRRKKKKRPAGLDESSRAGSAGSLLAESPVSTVNVWTTLNEEVDFICSRTNLQPETVKSVYHANGARLPATIRALATKEGAAYGNLEDADPIMDLQIAEFRSEYDHVSNAQLYGLLVLARNIPSAARELLEAMTTSTNVQKADKIYGLAPYAPVDVEKDNQPLQPSQAETWATVEHGHTRELATAHGLAANQAFAQAAAAYKRGKSDRLMGGAAAYYASVGHERAKAAKELQQAAANAHVTAQSTPTVLDLHGVSVADAVRIASYKTHSWWDQLGDAKYARGGGGPVQAGYKIVTGVGSHSKNHAPRIGPAVSKMLINDGWRVEIGHGELIVTGKARR